MLTDGPCLLAVAAPREVEAVLAGLGRGGTPLPRPWSAVELDDRFHLVVTGVGKANAAGAVARALSPRHSGVLSLGLGGALPVPSERSGLRIGEVLLADTCFLADEGLGGSGRFATQSQMGFPAVEGLGERFPTEPGWCRALAPLAAQVGPCATVSTCSGSDGLAGEIARRTSALCEDMESAAVGLVASRLGAPFACLRVISNHAGDRSRQGWDPDLAFSVLAEVCGSL